MGMHTPGPWVIDSGEQLRVIKVYDVIDKAKGYGSPA